MDLRDHGDSDDEDLRFAGGTEEYLDVLGAWDWLAAQGVPEDRIGILGMSFGAATTVIAGGEEPGVAGRLGGLVLRRHGRGDPRLPRPRGLSDDPGARWRARGEGRGGRRPDLEEPAARRCPNYAGRPLAIVHGEADTLLSPHYAEELRDAANASGVDLREFWLVPGIEHTRAVIEERVAYEPRLVDFFTGALGTP